MDPAHPHLPAGPGGRLPGRTWWSVALTFLAVGAALRVSNLGSFSLWVDEIVTMRFSALPLPRLLAASAGDAENVPVYLVVTHLARGLGLDDPWIRLPAILAGLGSILLLMAWTRRHFGDGVALITGAFCALSPFHIRYSQELRAYPYLLLMVPLTLLAGDRLRRRPDLVSIAALAGTIALGFYTHLTYVLVLPPLAGLVLSPRGGDPQRVPRRALAGRLAVAIAVGVAAFLPWLLLITARLGERMTRGGVKPWTLDRIAERWHFLTVAPWERLAVGWLGVAVAALAVLGVGGGAHHPTGRAVLLPVLPTLVAWEATLMVMDHWTAGRYDTALWPFLAVLIALGTHALLRLLRRPILQVAIGAVLITAIVVEVDAYLAVGRPRWDAVGQAIELVRRPREPVLALNRECRDSVAYYVDPPVRSIDGDPRCILRTLQDRPSLLLVDGEWQGSREVLRLARRQTLVLHVVQPPFDADLYRITSEAVAPVRSTASRGAADLAWPEPAATLVPESLTGRPPGPLTRLLHATLRLTEEAAQPPGARIAAAAFADLGSGWSPIRNLGDGTQYRWVVGREASLEIRRDAASDATLEVRLRPPPQLAGSQVLRVLVNGHEVAVRPLERGYQTVTVATPGAVWRSGPNLLVLQLRGAVPEPDPGAPWQGPPPRAAAVDWVEVLPQSAAAEPAADSSR